MTSYVIASGMKLGTGYFPGYSGFLSLKYHTVHTNTLYTLLVTITRPAYRLSKAIRHLATPIRALQKLSKGATFWQPPFELCSDSRSLISIRKRL